jgi:hypothetical protein
MAVKERMKEREMMVARAVRAFRRQGTKEKEMMACIWTCHLSRLLMTWRAW